MAGLESKRRTVVAARALVAAGGSGSVRVLRTGVVAFLVLLASIATAPPVAAHGVDGVEATNFRTEIVSMVPSVEGLQLRAVDLGESLEFRNTTSTEVTVLGYEGEPYLRVGPEGVFENRASRSWAVNREPDGSPPEPTDVDENAPPSWVRVASGDTVRWHDHRAHWMSESRPASVRDEPGTRHVVQEFRIELLHGDRPVAVAGELVWVPPPTPWPWLGGATGLAVAVIAASRSAYWRAVFLTALAVLVISETVHITGTWGATTASVASKLGAGVLSIGAVAVAVIALVRLLRRSDPYDTTPLVLVAGLMALLAGGVADLEMLWNSQLPTTLPPVIARGAVTLALGLGAGLVVSAAMRIRRPAASATS